MEKKNESGMSGIVKVIARVMVGFMLLFAGYFILLGDEVPGGGFPAGVMIALSYILITLAYGREFVEKRVSGITASKLTDVGVLIFLFVGIFGLYFAGTFLNNFLQNNESLFFTSGTIIINDVAIALTVGMSLYLIFLALAIFGRVVCEGSLCKDLGRDSEEEEE